MTDLSIITLTVSGRESMLAELSSHVQKQIGSLPVEHLVVSGDDGYGAKMRRSLVESSGRYVCWLDDDDWCSGNYVSELLKAVERGPDVVTLRTTRTDNGQTYIFRTCARDGEVIVGGEIKTANHYCAWRRELAMSVPFPPINYGCDVGWYTLMNAAYKLSEVHVPLILHHYRYSPSLTMCQRESDTLKSLSFFQEGISGWKHNPSGEFLLVTKSGDDGGPVVSAYRSDGTLGQYARSELTYLCVAKI